MLRTLRYDAFPKIPSQGIHHPSASARYHSLCINSVLGVPNWVGGGLLLALPHHHQSFIALSLSLSVAARRLLMMLLLLLLLLADNDDGPYMYGDDEGKGPSPSTDW